MQKTMGRLAVVSFLVAWGNDSHATDDTVLTWLAAGSKGAACSIYNDSCIASVGFACVVSQCDTGRSIANVTCGASSDDCNPCVNNVRQKFDEIFYNGWWSQGGWHYSDGTRYPPSNLKPSSVYDDGDFEESNVFDAFWGFLVDLAGIPIHHVQGFVHTNSTSLPFAVSHSDDERGSIALIRPNGSSFELDAIHATDAVHPSGMFALGKYVGFTDGSSKLRLLDLTRSRESHRIILDLPREMVPVIPPPLPSADFDCWSEGELVAAHICNVPLAPPPPHSVGTAGGGIAMVRLAGGGHLIVASQGNREGGNHFVLLEGNLEQPTRLTYLGFTPYGGPSDFIGSENLSIVTECGTGDIYTVHADGDDMVNIAGANTAGEGYYRLSKLTWNGPTDKPILTYQTSHVIDQDDSTCWVRGAGTIYSTPLGEEQAYCHSRDTESSGRGRFLFKQLVRSVAVPPPDPGGDPVGGLCGEPPLPTCL